MTLSQLIAEIHADLSNYSSRGLINDTDLKTWFINKLKLFGQTITEPVETILDLKGGKACLPEDFQSVITAYRCTPLTYSCNTDFVDVVQSSIEWKEKTERNVIWSSCNPCCTKVEEKTIIENRLIENIPVAFHYSNPTKLNITKRVRRDFCDKKYLQMFSDTSLDVIDIDNTSLFANFSEGSIYFKYNGLTKTEQGDYFVPDSPRGKVQTYFITFLKFKLFEKWLLNGDDENLINKFNYLKVSEKEQFEEAIRDAKLRTLTPDSYKKLASINKLNTMKVEFLLPQVI